MANDQMTGLLSLEITGLRITTYDGDSPREVNCSMQSCADEPIASMTRSGVVWGEYTSVAIHIPASCQRSRNVKLSSGRPTNRSSLTLSA